MILFSFYFLSLSLSLVPLLLSFSSFSAALTHSPLFLPSITLSRFLSLSPFLLLADCSPSSSPGGSIKHNPGQRTSRPFRIGLGHSQEAHLTPGQGHTHAAPVTVMGAVTVTVTVTVAGCGLRCALVAAFGAIIKQLIKLLGRGQRIKHSIN